MPTPADRRIDPCSSHIDFQPRSFTQGPPQPLLCMETAAPGTEPEITSPVSPNHPKGKEPLYTLQSLEATQDACVICLCPITERAVASPCNHLTFDFLCLVSWLQEQSSCPLCKVPITSVQYDWRAPDDYKTYRVPEPSKKATSAPPPDSRPRWQRGRSSGLATRNGRRYRPYAPSTPASVDQALARRRRVYAQKKYSLHVGANRVSQFRDFTPSKFADSAELQSRARIFVRRELRVFSFLQDQSRVEFFLEYVVGILKKLVVKGSNGAAENLVAEFLGRENARLFLHELEAWLRSPYMKLDDWDRHVQYAGFSETKSGASESAL